jgi:probable F420-dependent oxidoreductase
VAHSRKIRFGVEMLEPFEGMSWAESARRLEDLGYSTLFVSDHFNEGYGPIAGMAAAVAATTTLKVASAVFAPDFRHPAVLAHELASIDQISSGRLEVGIGAGYMVEDFVSSGIRMDPPGVRVDRMIEYVTVLRGLFGEGPFSFTGTHYNISALEGVPTPFTPGGPPIFIAGGGKRLLSFAATTAEIIGVNVSLPSSEARAAAARDGVPSSIDEKLSWIREAAGDRFDDIEIHDWVRYAFVTNDSASIVSGLSGPLNASEEDVRSSPMVLVGDVGEIVERVHARRDRWGYSYFTIQQPVALEFADVVSRLTS